MTLAHHYRPGVRVRILDNMPNNEAANLVGTIETALDTSQSINLVVVFDDGRKLSCTDANVELEDTSAIRLPPSDKLVARPADIEDPTRDPRIEQLPAVTTSFTPEQFKAWLASEGDVFVVYLPGDKPGQPHSFVIKVPDAHNAFFVAMMQQVRFCLGAEVKAVRMTVAQGPPADTEGEAYAPGTAAAAPDWAKPEQQFTAAAAPRKIRCPGSGKPPTEGTVRFRNVNPTPDNPGYDQGKGACAECGGQYKMTDAGNVRVHYRRA